jgi:hypothetical protein
MIRQEHTMNRPQNRKRLQLKKRRAGVAMLLVALMMNLMFVLAPNDNADPVNPMLSGVVQASDNVQAAGRDLTRFLPGAFR